MVFFTESEKTRFLENIHWKGLKRMAKIESVYGFKENKCKERVLPEKETLSTVETQILLCNTFLKDTKKSSDFCTDNTIPKKSSIEYLLEMKSYQEKDAEGNTRTLQRKVEDLELLNISYTQYNYNQFLGDLVTPINVSFKNLKISVTKDKEGNCIHVVIENATENDIKIPDGELTLIFLHKICGSFEDWFKVIESGGNRYEKTTE